LLEDIDKDTVDFQDTYDASGGEPKVLPARFLNLLSQRLRRIAVGIATNIPPHNLTKSATARLPSSTIRQSICRR
jgi:DNA gyrase subunit A